MSEPEASFHNAEPQGFENSAGEEQGRLDGAPSPAAGENPFYADAHYEPAGSTTTPPRYYTPPVRQERVKRERPARTREKRRESGGATVGSTQARMPRSVKR